MRVELEDLVEATATRCPTPSGRTVYRIVQEGITNARKHAPGALLTVEISGTPDDGIDVLLRNPIGFGPTRTPGAGLGLVGLDRAGRAARRPAEHASGRLDLRAARLDTVEQASTIGSWSSTTTRWCARRWR